MPRLRSLPAGRRVDVRPPVRPASSTRPTPVALGQPWWRRRSGQPARWSCTPKSVPAVANRLPLDLPRRVGRDRAVPRPPPRRGHPTTRYNPRPPRGHRAEPQLGLCGPRPVTSGQLFAATRSAPSSPRQRLGPRAGFAGGSRRRAACAPVLRPAIAADEVTRAQLLAVGANCSFPLALLSASSTVTPFLVLAQPDQLAARAGSRPAEFPYVPRSARRSVGGLAGCRGRRNVRCPSPVRPRTWPRPGEGNRRPGTAGRVARKPLQQTALVHPPRRCARVPGRASGQPWSAPASFSQHEPHATARAARQLAGQHQARSVRRRPRSTSIMKPPPHLGTELPRQTATATTGSTSPPRPPYVDNNTVHLSDFPFSAGPGFRPTNSAARPGACRQAPRCAYKVESGKEWISSFALIIRLVFGETLAEILFFSFSFLLPEIHESWIGEHSDRVLRGITMDNTRHISVFASVPIRGRPRRSSPFSGCAASAKQLPGKRKKSANRSTPPVQAMASRAGFRPLFVD